MDNQQSTRKVFEISMFWNEETIFVERIINTLDYASFFYIAEGNESLSGHLQRDYQVPKLLEQISPKLRERVFFVPYDFKSSDEKNPLVREKMLRDAALDAARVHPEFLDDAVLVVQDFDEFLNPNKINELVSALFGICFWKKGVRIKQRLSYYYLNQLCEDIWTLSFACKGSLAKKEKFSANTYRHHLAKKKFSITKKYLGWHHSYLGGAKQIKHKLASFAEAQFDFVKNVTESKIEQALKAGKDLYGRPVQFKKIDYAELEPIPILLTRKDLLLTGFDSSESS